MADVIAQATVQLGQVLLERKLTIAVAESLTGGELAAEIVKVPGISASFQGGTVAYQFAAKRHLLGVEQSLLDAGGAVQAAVAAQMAAGVRRQFSFSELSRPVDVGVSTTGVAGPDPADGREPGTVFVGIDSVYGREVVELQLGSLVRAEDPFGSRQRVRSATVEFAVQRLVRHICGH